MNINIFLSQDLVWLLVGMLIYFIISKIKQYFKDKEVRENYRDDDDDGTNGWNRW